MRNIFFILSLLFCIGCGDDVVMGTETEGFGVCGNGVVEENEECDEFGPDCFSCILNRRIFLLDYTINGTKTELDNKCVAIAQSNNLYREGITWTVWLSNDFESANDKFFKSPFKYELVDGTLIANNYDELISGNLKNPINMTSYGSIIEGNVWTGTLSNGNSSGYNCLNWDSFMARGTYGLTTATDKNWTNAGEGRCTNDMYVYCVENKKVQSLW